MSRLSRRWLIVAGCTSAALVLIVVVALLVAQGRWFGNYVKDKVVATMEDSTGGHAEIGSFEFDPWHLTVRIKNLVLHGTEPAGAQPLARVALLELHLRLFAGLKKTIDLAYLGVSDPRVNLIVNPNGATNIPAPKVKTEADQTSGLQSVVDLAIGEFRIDRGQLLYSQRSSQFSAQGQNLHALLNFNSFNSTYAGRVEIDPLIVNSLPVHVSLPVMLEKDAISISGGRLVTAASQILINTGLRDLNSPHITVRLGANVSLAELQKSFQLPLDLVARNVPQFLVADLNADYDDKTKSAHVQAAHIVMGQTSFEAAGNLQPGGLKPLQFNGKLALDQLSRLAGIGTTQLAGALQIHGHATIDSQKNYALGGTLNSQALSIHSGTTNVSSVRLSSPFHADPSLISLDGLKLNALGGDVDAKIFIKKLNHLSLESRVSNFSIPVLSRALAGRAYGYDGTISGSINAESNLKAKGTNGLVAQTALIIAPGMQGVPLSGRINGNYNGATGVIALKQSFLALPNSRVDLAGDINKQLNVNLLSSNLNDFKPIVPSLPITLQGGALRVNAQIKGDLSTPLIFAHADVDRFAVNGTNIQNASLDMAASSSSALVTNGVIASLGLQSNFDASIGLHKWQPVASSLLTANVSVANGDLRTILALADQKDLPASGRVNADIHINGTYGDPLGHASFQLVNGVAYNQPFDKVQANFDLTDRLITLTNFEVDAASGQLIANATFHHPSDSFQTGHADFHVKTNNIQLGNIQPLQQRSPETSGLVNLIADASADIRAGSDIQIANVSTDFSARGLKVNNQSAGDLVAQARTSKGYVSYNIHSDFAGSAIQVDGTTSLAKDYSTRAAGSIKNLSVEKALGIAGQATIPAKGVFSASASVSGTMTNPDAVVDLTLSKAVLYTEPVDQLKTMVHYTGAILEVPSLDLEIPAGTLHASASYAHTGQMKLHVTSSDLNLSKITHLTQLEPGVSGGVKMIADIAGDVRTQNGAQSILFSDVNADVNAHSLRANGHDLGELHATAKTQQRVVKFNLESNLAQTNLRASGQTQLNSEYVTHAKLTFGNVRYANIAPFIPSENASQPAFDALLDGEASIDGPVRNLDALTARLQLNQLLVRTNPTASATGAPGTRKVQVQTEGPAILTLDHSVINVQQLKIQGTKTYLQAGGSFSLKNAKSALGLTVKGEADLGILQDADRDFYSSGSLLVDATLHGSIAQPLLNGRLELKNANVNYSDAPNGLSNGNGVILLNGTNAAIERLTGESGGGKIAVTGFAGFTPTDIVFNLRASATKVRTRYSGASLTSSAALSLAGTTRRSSLNGTIIIQRIAYSSSSDAGALLSNASVPPASPAAPSPLLSGMHLDLRIVTAPDLRIVTTYAQKISLTSNLSVRGTAQDPGVVGRLNVTNGELLFFGNTYTVNTGSVNFYNPNAIEPILDLSLETIAQGVDVTLGVTGPVNDLKLSYRSDPALSFEQIVQLLATNTTPSDPTIAAHQPTPPQQSVSQMGESAVLGQAVANPLASRVQRVFGLTQFKIDPSFSGSNGQPSARVTLQQKITSNLTFTYITDVTQTNSEIVRVQLDITPRVSAVALRDYNGNVSLEFFYKFQVR